MAPLTLFGLCAVTLMLVCYAFEHRNPWWIFGFAVACALGSAYGFLQGAWPFGVGRSDLVGGCAAPLARGPNEHERRAEATAYERFGIVIVTTRHVA
jgi:hypothetical protein